MNRAVSLSGRARDFDSLYLGSIPSAASIGNKDEVSGAPWKRAVVGSTPTFPTNFAELMKLVHIPGLDPGFSEFDSPVPHQYGGDGETVNTAGCDPAIMGSTPILHPTHNYPS